jgi:hypothetical protein
MTAIGTYRPTLDRDRTGSESARVVSGAVEACRRFPLDEISLTQTVSSTLCRSTLLKLAGAAEAEYEDILILSGRATAFAYHPQRPQPMQATPEDPAVVDARIAAATGFAWEALDRGEGGNEAWTVLRLSVDEGRAVHGGWIDDLILCGYDDPGPTDERAVLVGGGWDLPAWWSWDRFDKWAAEFGAMARVGDRVALRPRSEIVREVMEVMARCAEDDPRAGVQYLRHAAYGLRGIEAFASDVADVARRPGYWNAGWLAGHCIYRQISGRAAAARYLRRAVADLPVRARVVTERAAQCFEQAAVAWAEWGGQLGHESGKTDAEEIRLLWLQAARRAAGAAAVRRAHAHESEAARLVKQALAA